MSSIRTWDRISTEADLAIGTGTLSGENGEWRITDVLTDDPLVVYLDDDSTVEVANADDWRALPEIGLTAIRRGPDTWMGSDEYRYHGEDPRYGLMLRHHRWRAIKMQVFADAHRCADERKSG
jgi:hypothetical protein